MKQHGFRRGVVYFLPVIALAMASGCDKTVTDVDPGPIPVVFDPLLETSRLSLAIPRGWTESFDVAAVDKDLNAEGFTATSGNAAIATVARSGNRVTVTGVSHGRTSISVTSSSGRGMEVPVNIYDHRIMETDELLLTYSLDFERRYSRTGVSFWHPRTTDGFMPIGSLALSTTADPTGKQGVMVVKAKAGSNALAHPTDYVEQLYMEQYDVSPKATAWRPVPPDGYVALGMVVATGRAKPPLDAIVTVRRDLTVQGSAGEMILQAIDRDAWFAGTERRYR